MPVHSQSASERKKAISSAFEELLVRITGKRDVLGMSSGQNLLRESRRFVRSFRYEELLLPTFDLMDVGDETQIDVLHVLDEAKPKLERPTQKITVSFDEVAVKNSLWQHELPVWGKTRPTTLVWLATEEGEQRATLDASEPSKILALFEEESEKRGVPMVYPRLDSHDQSEVNVTDILGSHKLPVMNASLAYQAEAIISASFLYDPIEGWQTRWNLYQANDEASWRISAPDLEIAIFEGVDKLASLLADRYAQTSTGNDSDRFLLYIQDISNLTDYDKINRYLDAISLIKRVELVQIQGNELVYELELRSHLKALKQAIALGRVLVTQDDPFVDVSDAHRLTYRFVP